MQGAEPKSVMRENERRGGGSKDLRLRRGRKRAREKRERIYMVLSGNFTCQVWKSMASLVLGFILAVLAPKVVWYWY